MALDKLVDSSQLDSDLTSVANAIRTKGGTSAQLAFPAGFVSAIGDISGGGGETVYYSTFNGAMYTEHFVYPTMWFGSNVPSILRSCEKLKSIYLKNNSTSKLYTSSQIFAHNSALETAVIDSYWNSTNNNREFQGCTMLKEVQLGGIGHPVSAIHGNTFAGCTQSGLTITIYVADSTTIPLANSPWGATNATIVYRSSTTGEVRTA